jgi:hypothetical protein
MRHRAMVWMLSALLVGVVETGWVVSILAGAERRHDGTVEGVDVRTRTLTVSELVEGGAMRTLHVRIPPNVAIVRSEPLPSNQVTDIKYPFKDSPISLSDVRPGDFVVVELSGTRKKPEARSITVTFEPRSTAGRSSPDGASTLRAGG